MATVRIPPVLRPAVGGEKELNASGSSVGEILRSVADAHPDTQSQLFAADGGLNRYVNVYLNDEDVRVLDGLDTSVGDGDTLVILPAMAGGITLWAPSEALSGPISAHWAGGAGRASRYPRYRRLNAHSGRAPRRVSRFWP
jgi:molybdopterin converting factor small subunit